MITTTPPCLNDFKLLRLDFALNPRFASATGQAQIQTEFKIRHELQPPHLRVYLTIAFNDADGPFRLQAEGLGLFDLPAQRRDAELEQLVNEHCALVLFPYLRELVADITRRAGFPPLHIPHVDFARVFAHRSREAASQLLH
ncbi:protein-export chaperone SecB [Desulfuromonas thiophila]|jgi:preprotein translocase subunit SecB|uniref:Protein translocase subunit secB n=1 Tax=Desulfuromonas thiophila TaxID=57664 RepID=A0A1G7EAG8_9BACT|nr:protein-export chaperone SecB [Desulfuromonas thiophila]MDD3801448.1 protein-export chaperone SecB [Desulfuromonas thiophila]SDE60662.1 protein translocase subunit secB [Desulfuromonas thiophila]